MQEISKEEWEGFLATLSPELKALAEKYPAWECYETVEEGHHCHVTGYWDPFPTLGYAEPHLKIVMFVEHLGAQIEVLHVKPDDIRKQEKKDPTSGMGGVTLH